MVILVFVPRFWYSLTTNRSHSYSPVPNTSKTLPWLPPSASFIGVGTLTLKLPVVVLSVHSVNGEIGL